jgi:nucleotide-binding universal stress UspA family protein
MYRAARGMPTTERLRRPLARVLVATDFSPYGDMAVDRAARLPLASDATVVLMHVLASSAVAADAAIQPLAKRHLEMLAERFRETAHAQEKVPRLRLVTRAVVGTPFVEIVRRARRLRADLIVVGRHGERVFRDLVMGSTAERVLRKGGPSVLVANLAPSGPYARPLVAVDTSAASVRALAFAWRVVDPALTKLTVGHVTGAPMFGGGEKSGKGLRARRGVGAATGIEAFLREAGPAGEHVRVVLGHGDPRAGLLELVREEQVDLVVLGTHGRSGVQRILLGSVAEAVARNATCDILVVRPHAYSFRLP